MKTSSIRSLLGTSLVGVLVCGAGAESLAAAAGQGTPPPSSAPAAKPEPGANPIALPGVEEARRTAPPLLREGSFVTRTLGSLREDAKRHEWIFTMQTADRSGVTREFVLLPNEALGEAARTSRLAPKDISFELTGETFIYHGRNYILPSLLTPFEAALEKPSAPETKPAASVAPAQPALPQDEEAIAKELERRLAERIDRLPKPAVAPPPNHREPNEALGGGPDSTKRPPMRGDTQIQSRRGQLVRDNATGGWRYVFEGQLPDGGEPSMQVLPCLALERIEANVRQTDVALPLTVTGTTTVFEGRTYLLPSIFRVARGGKGINP